MEKNIREKPAVTLNVRLQEHRNAISKGGEREKKSWYGRLYLVGEEFTLSSLGGSLDKR